MCPDQKQHLPIQCLNGTYANETKSVKCKSCPAGFSCLYLQQSPVECIDGYYSPERTSQCFICPSGHR